MILAKNTKWSDDEEYAYTVFSNARNALSLIDKYKIIELKKEVFELTECDNYNIRRQDIATLCFTTRLHLSEYKNSAYEMFLNDDDDDVRATALSAWAAFYLKTKDIKALKKLRNILMDSELSPIIRVTAYTGILTTISLHDSNNQKLYMDDELSECDNPETFNKLVDWDALDKFIKQHAPDVLK